MSVHFDIVLAATGRDCEKAITLEGLNVRQGQAEPTAPIEQQQQQNNLNRRNQKVQDDPAKVFQSGWKRRVVQNLRSRWNDVSETRREM
jgi:hypothetical protein